MNTIQKTSIPIALLFLVTPLIGVTSTAQAQPSQCHVANLPVGHEDPLQDELCMAILALDTVLNPTPDVSLGHATILHIDTDNDGIWDYGRITLNGPNAGQYDLNSPPPAQPGTTPGPSIIGSGGDDCGINGPLPTDPAAFLAFVTALSEGQPLLDGNGYPGCLGQYATITLRIDLFFGSDPTNPKGFPDPVMTLQFGPAFPLHGAQRPGNITIFPDGSLLYLYSLSLQDPRRDLNSDPSASDPRVWLTVDTDNDHTPDVKELLCLSNPLNPNSDCMDPDGDSWVDTNGDGFEDCNRADVTKDTGGNPITDSNGHAVGCQDGKSFTPDAANGKGPTDAMDWDTDDDGIADNVDPFPTDRTNGDADGDGLLTVDENSGCANPYHSAQDSNGASVKKSPATTCPGASGATDGHTNPASKDSDSDKLTDREEVKGEYPIKDDSATKLPTCVRVAGIVSDPNNADTDHDDTSDFDEMCYKDGETHTDPNDATSKDTDRDKVAEAIEQSGAENPYCAPTLVNGTLVSHSHIVHSRSYDSACAADPSNGNLTDKANHSLGRKTNAVAHGAPTDPTKTDTDNDGLSDYEEMTGNYDTSACGSIGGATGGYRTDPNNPDTDGDGIPDGKEDCGATLLSSDPTDPCSTPDAGNVTDLIGKCGLLKGGVPGPNDICTRAGFTGSFPDCVTTGLPGGDQLPDPMQVLLNPKCNVIDFFQGENPASPGTGADCGTLGQPDVPLDVSDPHDSNGNGITDEPNGQIDLVESHVFWVDPDEPTQNQTSKAPSASMVYRGTSGATVFVYQPQIGFAGSRIGQILRVGDVASTPNVRELLVLEDHILTSNSFRGMQGVTTPSDVTLYCLYQVGGEVRFVVSQGQAFTPGPGTDPCGQKNSVYQVVNNVLPGGYFDTTGSGNLDPTGHVGATNRGFSIQMYDDNDDGIVDRVSITPDPQTCGDPTNYPDGCGGRFDIPGDGLPINPNDLLGVVEGLISQAGGVPDKLCSQPGTHFPECVTGSFPPPGCPSDPAKCVAGNPVGNALSNLIADCPGSGQAYVCERTSSGPGILTGLVGAPHSISFRIGPIYLDGL